MNEITMLASPPEQVDVNLAELSQLARQHGNELLRQHDGEGGEPRRLEDDADTRIYLARSRKASGVFGIHFGNESVFFIVETPYYRDTCRNGPSRVFLLSYWVDGTCEVSIQRPAHGERRPFLPVSVLFGRFDPSRIPRGISGEARDDLEADAELIVEAIRHYDDARGDRGRNRQRRR